MLQRAVAQAESRRADAAVATAAEERLLTDKGWSAMGAFDPAERSRVLDLLGVEGQLVFATFATSMFAGRDLDRLYAGSVCAEPGDRGVLLRRSPSAAGRLRAARRARARRRPGDRGDRGGRAAVMVPSTAAGEAPTHPDLDGFWDVLNESGVPFVLHVGGGGRLLDPAFHNNDMPVTDHFGGGENIRSKDFLAIHHSPELFLGALIYDGLFDRFPKLRGGCIEQGAGWVVSWMRHLDYGQRAFHRTEEPLRRARAHAVGLRAAPPEVHAVPGEPIGWMIEQAGDELFMFSTDYPHPEGGKDPLAKFEEAFAGSSAQERSKFFYDNMHELLHGARAL